MFTILGADGKEYGPVTLGHVAEWIRDGRANLQTKARRAGDTQWKVLGEFEEFGARRPAPPPVESAPPLLAPEPEPVINIATPEVATRWLRLPAAMIDGLLKTLAYLPITVPLFRLVLKEAMSGTPRSLSEISQMTSGVVNTHLMAALPYLGLLALVQLVLLTWRGQSVGKFVLRLRIVRVEDGQLPGLYRAFLLRGTVPFIIEQIPVAGLFFWLVDSSFIFRPDQRCFHDLLAGTVVVRA